MQKYDLKKIAKTKLSSVSPLSERMSRCQRWKCDICIIIIGPFFVNLPDIKISCLNVKCGPHQTLPPYCKLRGHWGLSGLSVTNDMACPLFYS